MLGCTMIGWIVTVVLIGAGGLLGYGIPRLFAQKRERLGELALVVAGLCAAATLALSPITIFATAAYGVALVTGLSWPLPLELLRGR